MKTFLKFIISFTIGVCLILVGISLGGLNALGVDGIFSSEYFVFELGSKEKMKNMSIEYDHHVSDLTLELNNAVISIHEHDKQNVMVSATNIYEGYEMTDNHGEIILKQSMNLFGTSDQYTAHIDIYVPVGYEFDSTNITNELGYVEVNDLTAKNVEIEGTGRIIIHDMNADNVNSDIGFSHTSINDSSISNRLFINIGFGSMEVDMIENPDEYKHIVDVGFGAVKINSEKYAGISSNNQENDYNNKCIEVDCGFGAVEIKGGQ